MNDPQETIIAEVDRLRAENAQLKSQLADFHAAMEKEKSWKWSTELKDLAARLDRAANYSGFNVNTISKEDMQRAARELRSMANCFTHKANFVPAQLEIKELKAQLKDLDLHYIEASNEIDRLQCERDSARKACGDNVQTQIQLIEEHNSTLAKLSKCERECDQAQAACAEMREALETGSYFEAYDSEGQRQYPFRDSLAWQEAMSTDCGKHHINSDELTPTIDLLEKYAGLHDNLIHDEITRLKSLQEKAK